MLLNIFIVNLRENTNLSTPKTECDAIGDFERTLLMKTITYRRLFHVKIKTN